MNLNNFTVKAAEAFQGAQQEAYNLKNPSIETEHLLSALLQAEDSPVEYLLRKNNVNIPVVRKNLDLLLKKLPVISGEPAQAVGRNLNTAVLYAGSIL